MVSYVSRNRPTTAYAEVRTTLRTVSSGGIRSASEAELSPIRHLDRLTAPLILSYGSFESPEFKRHSKELYAAAQTAGKDVQRILAYEYNHFEILETLATPYGLLGRAALAQMGLAPA